VLLWHPQFPVSAFAPGEVPVLPQTEFAMPMPQEIQESFGHALNGNSQ
tara:strand:- start:1950 stop:2093 length:144 start_codon:yes stop_codon:yes gene_type:complete